MHSSLVSDFLEMLSLNMMCLSRGILSVALEGIWNKMHISYENYGVGCDWDKKKPSHPVYLMHCTVYIPHRMHCLSRWGSQRYLTDLCYLRGQSHIAFCHHEAMTYSATVAMNRTTVLELATDSTLILIYHNISDKNIKKAETFLKDSCSNIIGYESDKSSVV